MIKILSLICLLTLNIVYATPFITLSGEAMSGISSRKQDNDSKNYSQFESAANLNVDVEFSEKLSSNIVLGLGTTASESGFVEKIDFQAFNIVYNPGVYSTSYSLGYVGILFGQFAENQTSNASMPSSFFFNDLGYQVLTGGDNLIDLSGSGISTHTDLPSTYGTINAALYNGNMTGNENKGGGFGVALRYKNSNIKDFLNFSKVDGLGDITLGFSILNSNDRDTESSTNQLNANTTAIMFDGKTSYNNIEFGGYYMHLNLNDLNKSTNDNFDVFMGYASTNYEIFTFGGRISFFRPKSIKEGTTTNALSFVPGLSSDVSAITSDTIRHQLSMGINLDHNFKIHNEIIYDRYSKADYDNILALSYASLNF